MQKIIFYTTFTCSLCEQVEQMFSQYFLKNSLANTTENKFELEVFDIIDDEDILQKYRTKIPVLKNENSNSELCWPFDFSTFEKWISEVE